MKKYKMIVMSNPVEGRESEYNKWYSNQHISDLMNIPGIVAAQRFKLSETQRPDAKPTEWKYLALYEIESDNVEEVFRELEVRRGTPAIVASDAIAPERLALIYEDITPRLSATDFQSR